MQITITVGLGELRSLPAEWQQKILASLSVPVAPAAQAEPVPNVMSLPQMAQQAFNPASAMTFTPQPPQHQVPISMPTFAPPTQQVQQPTKQPTIQNGVPTFLPDRGFVTQQSVALDVMSGQPIQPPVQTSQAPVMPQFQAAPVNVAPVGVQGTAMAPMQSPPGAADPATVRSAAIHAFNKISGGREIVAAAEAASGVKVMALAPDNAHLLAHALRERGVAV